MSTRTSVLAVAAIALGATALTPANASAFGRFGGGGGFGGGFGGGHFGHAPSLGGRVFGGGGSARVPFPLHVVAGAHFAVGAHVAFRHPQERPQAGPPFWYVRFHRPFDGRTVLGSIDKLTTAPGAAAVAAARRAAERNQVTQSSGASNVTGGGYIFGQDGQRNGPGNSIPGVGNANVSGPQLNLPGSQDGQQQGPRSVPGIDNSMAGASTLNTPGETDNQNGPDAAKQAIAKLVGQEDDQVNQAAQGGASNLNIPTQSAPGQDVSRDSGNQNQNPGRMKAPDDANTDINVKEDPYSTFNGTYAPDGTRIPYGDTTPPPPPDHSADGAKGVAATVVAGAVAGPAAAIGAAATVVVISIINLITGSDPDPTDTGSTTSTAGGLVPDSPINQRNNGGGTGNNTEAGGGTIGGMAPGSDYARRTNGDGGGNDAGDNNRIGKGGTLATGSALTTKDQGDGGGSDSRGGGGTSTITGSAKIVNPGGGHNQLTGAVAGSN